MKEIEVNEWAFDELEDTMPKIPPNRTQPLPKENPTFSNGCLVILVLLGAIGIFFFAIARSGQLLC